MNESYIFALLLAALAGLAMAVQGTLNSALGKVAGLIGATFMVHIIGLLAVSVLLFVFRVGSTNCSKFLQAPWYAYLGGLISVGIIYAVASSISSVGVTAATTAIIAGQVATAALLDHLGLFGLDRVDFTWFKGIGIALLASGAWLLLRK